jgi:hypothetical protein
MFAITFLATTTHAAHSGSIEFRGQIITPASASMDMPAHSHANAMQTQALSEAQETLSAGALIYFATYASNDAKLISANYY